MPRTASQHFQRHTEFQHKVRVARSYYRMCPCWIDTTCPNDMMDYDFTMGIQEQKKLHEDLRLAYIRNQRG